MKTACCFIYTFMFIVSISDAQEPVPYGALPTPRQLEWSEMEYYMFVHFNMNTFTDMEWGTGGEDPALFNPTDLDCMQWARLAKKAGMTGIIITAKHHDGFVLWPSQYTEHSVKNSPWKNGQGDVLQELREACDAYGLKMGIYYSPWDRNHADYGTEKYLDYLHNQLEEVLTQYGEIFEVWFDGANGGTGYYGGANENRKVDRKKYYDWPRIWNHVRELQPNAVIFSDAGPDVRWVGNESGYAGETNWATLNRDLVWPGWPHYKQLQYGHKQGTHWVPAEVDVSIRPGWYYHASEDHKVKTLPELLDIYYNSIGRNASFLLNIPIDRSGQVHPADSAQMMALAHQLKMDFEKNLALGMPVAATSFRKSGGQFRPENVTDGDPKTFWATEEFTRSGALTLDLEHPQTINRLLISEYIPLGQRVEAFHVEVRDEAGRWQEIARETTIGRKRILRFEDVVADQVRLTIDSALASPLITSIELYRAPRVLSPPHVYRNDQDMVIIEAGESGSSVYYTIDGEEPDKDAVLYEGPFLLDRKAVLRAAVLDPVTEDWSPVTFQELDIPRRNWVVTSGDRKMIDGNIHTFTSLKSGQFVEIDLGDNYRLSGFTYTPDQSRYASGIVKEYRFWVSQNGGKWKEVARGEFANIKNNPVRQEVSFKRTKARFVRLEAITMVDDSEDIRVAEIGVVSE